jgi:hypothetical protein
MSKDTVLFLIDSEFPLNKIEEQLKNLKSFKIISFDFLSHTKLQNLDLDHTISDIYLNDKEIVEIQHHVYSFLKWYDDSKISKYLLYNGVNIAGLFHEQFAVYLSPFLKKLHEIKNIVKQFPNSQLVSAPNLSKISQIFSDNVSVLESKKSNNPKFVHDEVRYNLKIGKKNFLFLIPRNYYKKIKEISEFFIHKFFGYNKKYSQIDNMTLLVEFNTTRFKELFLESKKSSIFPVYYGRRRPAIWNLDSFSIIKKSGCKIVTSKSLKYFDKSSKNTDRSDFINNFNTLWENDVLLSNYFSIDNKSFWSNIKLIWKNLILSRIDEIIFEINMAKYFFEQNKIKSIIIFSEVGMTERIVIPIAKNNNVPISLLQVGHHWDTPEALEMNVANTVYPVNSDNFLVWGKTTETDAITNGSTEQKKIIPIGSPRYDGLFNLKTSSEDYILFAVTGPREMNVNDLTVETYQNHEQSVKEICKIVSKLNKKLIIKLHPGPSEYNITKLVKKINPNFEVITRGDILPLIKSCSIMITTRLSTSMLEAQILEKPVIYIPIFDKKFGNPEIFKSNSCFVSSLDHLESDLEKFLYDDNFKQNTINLANNFLKNYFINANKASRALLKFLENL